MTEHGYSPDFLVRPEQPCPWCRHLLNAVGQAQSSHCEVPEAGDVIVCIACAQVSIFGLDGTLRRAAFHEIDDTVRQVQTDIQRMQRVWHQY